jgi:hypothetical protein
VTPVCRSPGFGLPASKLSSAAVLRSPSSATFSEIYHPAGDLQMIGDRHVSVLTGGSGVVRAILTPPPPPPTTTPRPGQSTSPFPRARRQFRPCTSALLRCRENPRLHLCAAHSRLKPGSAIQRQHPEQFLVVLWPNHVDLSHGYIDVQGLLSAEHAAKHASLYIVPASQSMSVDAGRGAAGSGPWGLWLGDRADSWKRLMIQPPPPDQAVQTRSMAGLEVRSVPSMSKRND